ncbi:MAG: hypothetical protein ACC642_00465 [Pseudomonadales bacterium]
MSVLFHVSGDEGLISVRVESEIDLVGLYELAKSVHSDPGYDPTLPLLVDLRGMRIDLKRSAVEPFSRYIISHFNDRQASIAVVIDSEMEDKLCAAVYWLACAVNGAELFDDYDHALKWLIRREFADGVVNAKHAGQRV